MSNRPRSTWSYVFSMLSVPFLLLAHTGIFGTNARQESETAITDLGRYVRIVLPIGATVVLGIIIGAAVVLLAG